MEDINIDLLKPADSNIYSNLITSLGFKSLINSLTREVSPYSSCIDHVYFRSNMKLNNTAVTKCYTVPSGISDHHAVVVEVDGLLRHPVASPVTKKQTYQFTNWENLNASLASENWNSLLNGGSIDDLFNLFFGRLGELVSLNTKTIRKKPTHHKRNPWASDLLVRLSKQKNNLYRLITKFPNNLYLKKQYKNMSKKVQAQISGDKKNYFGKLLEEAGPNSRKYWRIVNSATGRENKGIEQIVVNSTEYDVVNNEQQVADIFNEYFINVTQTLSEERRGPSSPPESELNYTSIHNRNPNSLFMFPITTYEIFHAINSISKKNSVGADGIEVGVLKKCAHSIVVLLEILFNASISQGIFPEKLKTAVVVPVFKAGKHTDIANYRPIAIRSVISKVFKFIVKSRIMTFLMNKNFFSERQFGFLPGQSTDDALLSHITDVVSHTERGSMAVALYLDISKAFDTVDHDILLERLYTYDIRGVILDWFATYLKGRCQVVRIGKEISSPLKVTSGVPQGSTLGPLLFLIYVNELLQLKISGRIYSFADDTSVLFTAKNKTELLYKMETDLKILTIWFWKHKLYPNLNKT